MNKSFLLNAVDKLAEYATTNNYTKEQVESLTKEAMCGYLGLEAGSNCDMKLDLFADSIRSHILTRLFPTPLTVPEQIQVALKDLFPNALCSTVDNDTVTIALGSN